MAAERRARAVWEGTLLEGQGRLSTESTSVLSDQSVTWASRTEDPGGRTSPEELLAAAHAACYAMALSGALARRGTPAERLEVTAACSFDKVGEGWGVTTMRLQVRGRLPGLDRAAFEEAARAGEEGCPISNAIRGNVEIRLTAELEGSGMPGIWGLSKTAANYRQAPGKRSAATRARSCSPSSRWGMPYVRGAISASYRCDQFAPARPARGSAGPA